MDRQQLLELVTRLGNAKLDELRREAATDAESRRDIMAEIGDLNRGELIARIVDHYLGLEGDGDA
jgi:hypothetical protein